MTRLPMALLLGATLLGVTLLVSACGHVGPLVPPGPPAQASAVPAAGESHAPF